MPPDRTSDNAKYFKFSLRLDWRTGLAVDGSVDDTVRSLLDAVQTLKLLDVAAALQCREIRRQLWLQFSRWRYWWCRQIAVTIVIGIIGTWRVMWRGMWRMSGRTADSIGVTVVRLVLQLNAFSLHICTVLLCSICALLLTYSNQIKKTYIINQRINNK